MRLGSDDKYLNNRVKDYSLDLSKRSAFFQSVSKFLPFIKKDDLFGDTSCTRLKLQYEGGSFSDFLIKERSQNGLPGFINLIGIESPGLTVSLAIDVYVGALVKDLN